jgi:hypothetical protein
MSDFGWSWLNVAEHSIKAPDRDFPGRPASRSRLATMASYELTYRDLSGADLSGADFTDADVTGALFGNARELPPDQLTSEQRGAARTLPPGWSEESSSVE